jgi:type VI secretion system secreted protein VgrG
METYDWNFSTSANGQGTDKFRILAFTGEDSVCQGYRFDILLLVQKLTESEAPAFLKNMAEAGSHTLQGRANTASPFTFAWTGMPERVEWMFSTTDGGCVMRALLRPHSFKLRLGVHSRVFLGSAVPKLLEHLLVREGFTSGTDFTTTGLQQNYKARPVSSQYNESSFNFLLRHLERVGGYSYIEQNGATDRLVLADGAADVPTLPGQGALDWDPARKASVVVYSFSRTMATGPTSVTLRDYSTEKPGTESKTSGTALITPKIHASEVNYFGQFNMFGETNLDAYSVDDAQGQAQLMAQARARSLASRSNLTRGQSTVAWLRAGYYFTLSRQKYQILTTRCNCNCCDSNADIATVTRAADFGFTFDLTREGYNNSFTCHSLDLGPFAPEITARRPVVSGLTHAMIHASDGAGGYADLDAKGRYTVRLPFPEGVYDAGNAEVTGGVPIPLRMAQINASTKGSVHSGVHLPLLDGTEVLVGFTDGDPDRPVIMAALPNGTNTSVVTDDNNKTNVIKTPGGHTLTMDDTSTAPKITVTSNAGHTLTMDDTTTAPKITVTSNAGHRLTLDDTPSASNITLTSRGRHIIAVNDDDSANAVKIASSDGKMSLVMDQKDGKLTIRYGSNSTVLTGKKAYELLTTHKESTIGGNVYSSVLGASETFTVGEKLTMAAALSQTVNLISNLTVNAGLNNTLNLGMNSTSNIGSTMNFKMANQDDIVVGDDNWIRMSAIKIAANMLII